MTQAQLAKWLGVSIKQVKHLEHQRRRPSGPTRRLLDILAEQLASAPPASVQVLGAGVGSKKVREPAETSANEHPETERADQAGAPEIGADRDGAFTWE